MPEPKSIASIFTALPDGPDLTWAGPVHECLCGCGLFALAVTFSSQEIGTYFTDARCCSCGAWLTAPTLADVEEC